MPNGSLAGPVPLRFDPIAVSVGKPAKIGTGRMVGAIPEGQAMSNRIKLHAPTDHAVKGETPEIHTDDPSDADGHATERIAQEAREQAMAARVKATSRTQMSVGQSKVQRIYKGNQPKG
jgi:hypothetical protein